LHSRRVLPNIHGMTVPFQKGDLFLAATDVDDRNVDLRNHAGPGRVLHLDPQLRLRASLYTGQTGLVVGLAIDPTDGALYACDPGSQTITRFTSEGACEGPVGFLPRARIGSLLFLPDGRFVAGLHSKIGERPDAPGPRLWLGSARQQTATGFAAEIDGGKFGFHCVTHMSLAPDGRTLHYVSENGRRLMRWDIEARRQLPDLMRLPADDPRGTFGPAVRADGYVWMATGTGALLLTPDGRTELEIAGSRPRGWSRLTLSLDGRHFYLGNFIEGLLEKRDAASGDLLLTHDIQRKYSLSGVAEFP
jgi:sugar lactone lactonase YvrE